MNSITNILKTITTGLAMQDTADYLSNNEKQTCMKKAVEHKQRASESVAQKEIDEQFNKESNNKIDIDTVILLNRG